VLADAATWTAIGTWAMVLVLAITLVFVYRQVSEASKLRHEQSRPYVVVSIDIEQRFLFVLAVENVGTTAAHNVDLTFDKPLRSRLKEIEDVGMLQKPIPILPPRRRMRATWESSLDVFQDEYPHPLTYEATATYSDREGRKYGPEKYTLDFRTYRGQAAGMKGMPELVSAVESLQKEHAKWTDGVRGLLVHHVDRVQKARRDDRPWRIRKIREAYAAGGVVGAASLWIKYMRRRYGLWSR